jgi:hypothetical protein
MERLLADGTINAETTRDEAETLVHQAAWREALVDADADRTNVDFMVDSDEQQQQPVEAKGWLDIKVSGPPGMSVNASGAGMFKQTNVTRNIQMVP